MRKRLLLLLPTNTYRTRAFLDAAAALGADVVEVVVASEEPSTLQALNPRGLLTVDFRDPGPVPPVDAVIAVDEATAVAAAVIAGRQGLRHNPVAAARIAGDKHAMRETLARAGVPQPRFGLWRRGEPVPDARFPVVVKPLTLSTSRGVIRADDAMRLRDALERAGRIAAPDERLLIEEYVPGPEVALEGLLREGRLDVLTIFDKPDPLEGPHFEETIYVTPSRQPGQDRIAAVTAHACEAMGLREGPVHAELRAGPTVIEIAARSIGGLCSRVLRFGTGMSLEEILIRHALGLEIPTTSRESRAAGVMMMPIGRGGTLKGVDGIGEARAAPLIEDVVISAHVGQVLAPPPEGGTYLGFIFARGPDPAAVEAALRQAWSRLRVDYTSARTG